MSLFEKYSVALTFASRVFWAYEGKTAEVEQQMRGLDSREGMSLMLMAAARGGQVATFDCLKKDSKEEEIHQAVEDAVENAPIAFVKHLFKTKCVWNAGMADRFYQVFLEKFDPVGMEIVLESYPGLIRYNNLTDCIDRSDDDDAKHFHCFDVLISYGALNSREGCGPSPLFQAVRYNKPNIVRYLLEKGADPDKGDIILESERQSSRVREIVREAIQKQNNARGAKSIK